MANEVSSNNRPVKRLKVAGRGSYGTEHAEFTGRNTEKMFFDIYNFANLKMNRGEHLTTTTVQACGHQWRLRVFPRGASNSKTDEEYVSIFVEYVGKNNETNAVGAKAYIFLGPKRRHIVVADFKFSKGDNSTRGSKNFKKREDIIRENLNQQGKLTVEVEIEVASEKRNVWFPQKPSSSTNDTVRKLYRSTKETSDVMFVVGPSKVEIRAHKNVLAVRSRELYDLILTEESSSSSAAAATAVSSLLKSDITKIILHNVDANSFEMFIKFTYDILPDFIDDDNNIGGDDDGDVHENDAKLLLIVADRYGCTDLKLHMESYLIQKVLIPSKAARLLLVADSHSCPLLKEACMTYITDSNTVKQSQEDWKKLKESNDLLEELLDYAMSSRKQYSSYANDGNGTITDANDYDVRSLRERLEAYDLDLDGSREMLLQRWKEHLGDRLRIK